jgi:hypothetical protein
MIKVLLEADRNGLLRDEHVRHAADCEVNDDLEVVVLAMRTDQAGDLGTVTWFADWLAVHASEHWQTANDSSSTPPSS